MDPIITSASAIGAPLIKSATKGISTKITNGIGKISKAIADNTVAALQLGFAEYVETSYRKCRYFKTILNPNQPIEVSSNYINVNVSCGKTHISDLDLIDNLQDLRRVVITGLAGGGKSMFMKYLTVRYFENPRSIIPLFVEFRHINSMSKIDILTYVRTSCSSKNHSVTQDQFEISLKSGAIALILDGFDELSYDIRDEVEKQLLSIEKDFPEALVIISSRPDQRFSSWTSYHVYKVDPLSEAQTLQLVKSLDYDPSVKRRFIKEVEARLYNSHKSFLSSPLLASIMLLTFEEFAEIPQKMVSFYDRAFDTLFQKHDAQKEQYKRKNKTLLAREEFKLLFSAFCAMTYLEQSFSFSEGELHKYSEKAINYCKQTNKKAFDKVGASEFISDMFENVCMLQYDGLDVAFVHRSFQEYFAALFAANLRGSKIRKFLDRYSCRINDSAVGLAAEISRNIIEQEWILPSIDELIAALEIGSDEYGYNLGLSISKVLPTIFIERKGNKISISGYSMNVEIFGKMEAIGTIYGGTISPHNLLGRYAGVSISDLEFHAGNKPERISAINRMMRAERTIRGVRSEISEGHERIFEIGENDGWWLKLFGSEEGIKKSCQELRKLRKDISNRRESGEDLLDEFF